MTFFPRLIPILLVLSGVRQEVPLRWIPKEGAKLSYTLKGSTTSGDLEGNVVELRGETTETTIRVDDKQVVARTVGTLNATVPGQEAEVDVEFKPDTTTLSRDGRILAVEEDGDDSAFRNARPSELVLPSKPVSPGATWSIDEPADVKTKLPALKIDYTFVGEEKIGAWDTYKITSKIGDAKGAFRLEGSFWIEKTTGTRIRTHTKSVEPGPANDGPTTIEMDLTRKS